ncbi:dermonecrotic toxin domain-containing protein [Pseudomonas abietaniphila]|uniref:dermonecrotic toxin domain-containing protein n=1 Tax=Pseudomonas abietaniphila TaxID=89065 RepID=UPI0007850126|nr:DUF6543 domain-containing protein [Pseudomonas abietaniphila]
MTAPSAPYFHDASLRQRFGIALDSALHAQQISADEHQWLQGLLHEDAGDATDPVRVDGLTLDSNRPTPFELAAALLMSHGNGSQPQVYLYTLARGIERFEHRIDLLNALQTYFADADSSAGFEYEKLDGDPFQTQMLSIVDYQAEHVGRLTDILAQTPLLSDALASALTQKLSRCLPGLTFDPMHQLLQVVQRGSLGDADVVLMTQTLTQAAEEDLRGMKLLPGIERRFLKPDGQPLDESDTRLMAQALIDAVKQVVTSYGELLKVFWGANVMHPRTTRDHAIESFDASVRHTIYGRLQQGGLSALARETLYALMRSRQGALPAQGNARLQRLTLVDSAGTSHPLAGTFAIQLGNEPDAALLWYLPHHALHSFKDLASLRAFAASAQGGEWLRPSLALENQSILLEPQGWRLDLQTIEASLFAERVDSIIAMQMRNLSHALQLSGTWEGLSTMVDDALDVRLLLDPRQLQFSARRWRHTSFSFSAVWQNGINDDLVQVQAADPRSEPAPSWVEQTQRLDDRAAQLWDIGDGLSLYCKETLQRYLSVLSTVCLAPESIQIQWQAPAHTDAAGSVPLLERSGQTTVTVDLVSLLIERISGYRTEAINADAVIKLLTESGGADVALEGIDVVLVNHLLDCAAVDFNASYLRFVEQARVGLRRDGNLRWSPDEAARYLREDIVRLDLAVKRRTVDLGSNEEAMVRQILERPVRSLRSRLMGPVAEAFLVTVLYDNNRAVPLSDMLMVCYPQDDDVSVVLWDGIKGWKRFPSINQMQRYLRNQLQGTSREQLLALAGEYDRALLLNHLQKPSGNAVSIRLDRVDDHVFESLQRRALDHQQQGVKQACVKGQRYRAQADLYVRMAFDAARDSYLQNAVDALSARIDSALIAALLPDWLLQAKGADQFLYARRLHRFNQCITGKPDFLFDIPSLQSYSRARLVDRLSKDFPDQTWSPDQILVTVRRYVAGLPSAGQIPSGIPAAEVVNSESLTDYALNRFVTVQDAALSVSSEDQPMAAELLTPDYLRTLITDLDVGGGYMALLEKALTPKSPDYVLRRQYFFDQVPALLQVRTLEKKLQGILSQRGYDYVEAVIAMPDGIAREPVDGVPVIISPLQLVADRGMTPDGVPGVYLVCGRDPASGPVVLQTIFSSEFSFKEYVSIEALLQDIRSNEALQRLLLARLDPITRRRYAEGGFVEPHLPFSVEGFADVPFETPGPVTLELAEQKGNALGFMFSNAVHVLLNIGQENTVTNAEASAASTRFLMTLGVEQMMNLLPGKMGALVALFQSETLLRASAASASGKRWGEALSEFSAALGVLATAREQAEDDLIEEGESAADPEVGLEDTTTSFSWFDPKLTPAQSQRLRALEVRDIALDDLERDELLNLYTDAGGNQFYASVSGKVYRVTRATDQAQWMIVGNDGTPGPRLKLDVNQRWQLDLSLGLKGGGGLLTRIRSEIVELDVDAVMVVQASGMPEIRMLYRDKARRIGEAHLKSKRYLETCLDNLHVHKRGEPLDPRVNQILADFFGTATPDQSLLDEVESMIKRLYDEIMSASLSPFSSARYVVGLNREGQERTSGFVIKDDPKKRIFLTDGFFQVLPFSLNEQARIEGFELGAHFRSATLIHELSHLVADTYDIAYLETSAPYPDLLAEDNADNIKLKEDLSYLHSRGLSHLTEKDDLFLRLDDDHWRDMVRDDGDGFKAILRITGTRKLNAARDVFLADTLKRRKVLLSNADSVTLLILLLGRKNYAVPTP